MEEYMKARYTRWLERATEDPDLIEELRNIAAEEDKISDAFYRDMEFGTAGLRSIIGAGTNRMNIYTVAKASQGLADYVISAFPEEERLIAVAYDSRIKSRLFAETAAGVFAANGIRAAVYPELVPVPCLSYAVRQLHCAAGVMVTASHNPAAYNGYKVYGPDGGQLTEEAANCTLDFINRVDIFDGVKKLPFGEGLANGMISYIPETIMEQFIATVKALTVVGADVDRKVDIVYTPLNGAGLKPVTRILKEAGYTHVTVVKEQQQPDGTFPTCPYPNPEIREALALGLEYAAECHADLLLATDPDCDRVGIAVRNKQGEMELLTGNQVGMLLLDMLCAVKTEKGEMPPAPIVVKTIVTTDMVDRIAAHYGVRAVNVLTGFKYIGEQISALEKQGCPENFLLGFEESYGYLSGTHVRDKDGVNGSYMICEMFAYYKAQGKSLPDRLQELYARYGYCLNTMHSYSFEGAAGMEKMKEIMESFRQPVAEIAGKKVLKTLDYSKGIDGLPKSNVMKFLLEDNCSAVVRPSGTEPKVKTYLSVSAGDEASARALEKTMAEELAEKMR